MADEQVVDPAEAEEEEFTGEELQVGPEPGGDPDADLESDLEDEPYDDEPAAPDPAALAGQLPVAPPMIGPFSTGPRHEPFPAAAFQPRDPSEVLRDIQFDHLSPGDQAEALRQAGGRPEHSIDRARRDVLQERELAARAVVYREWPEEYQGTTIKGRVRAFKAPFTLANIEDWVATYRGGGKYKIQFYRGDGRYLESKVLDVEGDPILPGVKEDAEAAAREAAAAGGSMHDDRANALERQLAEERFERRMAEERARTDAQMGSITHALQSVAEAMRSRNDEPAKPPIDFAALAASAGPLVIAYLQSQDAKAAEATKQAREDRKALIEQQNAAEKRMMQMMTALQGKKETLSDAIKAMAEVKKLTAGDNTEAKAFTKILDTALPRLIDATTKIQLHKAGVQDGKDDEEFGAKMIVDRVTELASTFIASRGAAEPPPPQQVQPAVQSHGAYGVPVQQPPAPPAIPMRGGGQIVTPEQQAAHEASVAAGHAQPVQPAAQPMQPGAPAQRATPKPDVNFEVFDRAVVAMGEGKLGSELADELMAEEQANNPDPEANPHIPHLYLSRRVINYLCAASPELVMNLLNPQIRNAVAQGAPYQPLLDMIGQQFMLDFCRYFSDPAEEPEPEAAQPDSTGGADDLTGGVTAEGGDA